MNKIYLAKYFMFLSMYVCYITQYQKWVFNVFFKKSRNNLYSPDESENHSVMSDSLGTHGLYSPWNSPGQNTGVGSLSLLKGIFPTQGSNPGLPHYRCILYQLSHMGSPYRPDEKNFVNNECQIQQTKYVNCHFQHLGINFDFIHR